VGACLRQAGILSTAIAVSKGLKTMERSKRYRQAAAGVEKKKEYSLEEAVALLKSLPHAKFDETVEIACSLNLDMKKTEQAVRGSVSLPHGIGKTVTVAVFCEPEKEEEARNAGADYVGSTDLIDKIAAGWMEFDNCIATPSMMSKVSRLGKLLGPRGLMPSAKTGSVTENLERAVKETKQGKIDFKTDKSGCIQVGIGKLSFGEAQIVENARTFIEALSVQSPAAVKGNFVKSLYLSSTMSPGLRVSAGV